MIEMLAYFLNPARVANGNDGICQFFGPQIEVINGATLVDDKF